MSPCRCRMQAQGTGTDFGDRGDVHDRSAASMQHERHARPGHQGCAAAADRHDVAPLIGACPQDRLLYCNTRAVHQRIDAPEAPFNARDSVLHVGRAGHVALQNERLWGVDQIRYSQRYGFTRVVQHSDEYPCARNQRTVAMPMPGGSCHHCNNIGGGSLGQQQIHVECKDARPTSASSTLWIKGTFFCKNSTVLCHEHTRNYPCLRVSRPNAGAGVRGSREVHIMVFSTLKSMI